MRDAIARIDVEGRDGRQAPGTWGDILKNFLHRVIGAAGLDVETYEEVEADRTATLQAGVVVVASSLATGIGASGFGGHPGALMQNVFLWSVVALLGWAAWALLVLQIGGRLLPEPQTSVDVTELLRTIGFSTAPGLLRVFGIIPALTIPVFVLTVAWMLVAMIVAVRQALDYTSTSRAIAVCAIGWALAGAIVLTMGLWLTPSLS